MLETDSSLTWTADLKVGLGIRCVPHKMCHFLKDCNKIFYFGFFCKGRALTKISFWHSYRSFGIMYTQPYLQDSINKPIFDYSQYTRCLPVSKSDLHQSPCRPRECTTQGWLCAAPVWTEHTGTWPNKDSESGLRQQHLPGVAFEGVREVEHFEPIQGLLKIRQGWSSKQTLMELVEQEHWARLLIFLWISNKQRSTKDTGNSFKQHT